MRNGAAALTRRTYPKYPDAESVWGLVNPAGEPYSPRTIGAEAGQRYGAPRTCHVWQVWLVARRDPVL